MTEEIFVPPKAPKDLCFGELNFVEKVFDVDVFLHEHRKNVSLEKMRDDLGLYLKTLRSAMIELINKDYADFVNLSSNLIGLDAAIENLEVPLGQLREEVMQIRQALEDAITEMVTTMDKRRQIREYKRSLHSLIRIHKSVSKLQQILSHNHEDSDRSVAPDILERAATEFNQLKFHESRCMSEMSSDQHQKIAVLDEMLKTNLNALFTKNIKTKESTSLIRCLRIYVTLDKMSEAEEVVRTQIIRPVVQCITDEQNLQSEPLGLQGIYDKLENVLNEDLKELLDITLSHERVLVKGFNFIVNSFWPEVEDTIEDRLSLIFAPGNPELFHRRYLETLAFLSHLERMCATHTIASSLKNHPQYKRFLKKWNLPVYFQIRFQEIAGSAESVLCEDASNASMAKDRQSVDRDDFSLYTTRMIWDCLLHTWSEDVFLLQLFHKFWKLGLQLYSRYCEWCRSSFKQVWTINTENKSDSEFGASRLEFLVCLYTDIEKLINKLPVMLEMVSKKLPYRNPIILESMDGSVKSTKESLETCLPEITKEIVNELLTQSTKHLKQITDIPRLFRRTNRDIPTKPCTYVKNALNCLVDFHTRYRKIIPHTLDFWLISALSCLTEKYLSSVSDVLISVQKTEESLRRLKKIRDKSTGASSAEAHGVSDDDKIRIQLAIDVSSYVGIIKDLGIVETNVTYLQDLTRLVESAVKNKIEVK